MKIFTACPKCGKKKLAVFLLEYGMCWDCHQTLQLAEEKRHASDLEAANIFYGELSSLWHETGDRWCSPARSSAEAVDLVLKCDRFQDLFEQIPTIPGFQEIFAQHCDYLTAEGCRSKDFGLMRVTKVDEKTIEMNFDHLSTCVERCKEHAQKMIEASNNFRVQLEQIPQIAIIPDYSVPPLLSKKDEFPFFDTTNITARTSLNKIGIYYAVDVETTGLNPLLDEIIQIAAVRFINFEPVDVLTTYIKPRNGLKPAAMKINGITELDVAEAPYVENVINQLSDFLTTSPTGENAPIVGHNLGFDFKFLCANGVAAFLNKRKYYDTLELSRRQYASSNSFKLDDLVRDILHIDRSDAHSALSDALATGLLFKEICKERIGFS